MIHNPEVNNDLAANGIRFILETNGSPLMDWEELTSDDVVIIPAFGATLDWEKKLKSKGIRIEKYDTTCPFVEKVWNRSYKLGDENFTVVIHGKHYHEETRATFSRSITHGKSIIVKNLEEAQELAQFILGKNDSDFILQYFEGKFSKGFNPDEDLIKLGVVNQTTMLASETKQIADLLRESLVEKYGDENISDHFADTADTLCYATNDNQEATHELATKNANLAIVVGGYNSSNTSHLVELLEKKYPTYFINSPDEIKSRDQIQHFNIHKMQLELTNGFLPDDIPLTIAITSGASCPDTLLDAVMLRLLEEFPETRSVEDALHTATF